MIRIRKTIFESTLSWCRWMSEVRVVADDIDVGMSHHHTMNVSSCYSSHHAKTDDIQMTMHDSSYHVTTSSQHDYVSLVGYHELRELDVASDVQNQVLKMKFPHYDCCKNYKIISVHFYY